MEKISWTDPVRSEEVLQRVKEDRTILVLHKINRRLTGLLKHVTGRKMEGRIEEKEEEEKDVSL